MGRDGSCSSKGMPVCAKTPNRQESSLALPANRWLAFAGLIGFLWVLIERGGEERLKFERD